MNTQQIQTIKDFADELQQNMVGIQMKKSAFGQRKTFTRDQRNDTADALNASNDSVYGGTRLYAKGDPWIKAIHSRVNDALKHWIEMTIFYPERGVRLLPKDRLQAFINQMEEDQAALDVALREADEHYDEIIDAARASLIKDGRDAKAFDIRNYPASFRGTVTIGWSTYNYRPDETLLEYAPQTYQREKDRVAKTMDDTLARYEQECRDQMQSLVEHLLAKLKAADDGDKVQYNNAATTNFREFFDKFKAMNILSDQAMADLIEQADEALGSTSMQDLKKRPGQRRALAASFNDIKEQLSDLIVNAPTRSINFNDLED